MSSRNYAAAFALALLGVTGVATQTTFKEPPVTNAAWTRPMPGFRIVGNVYYVGTYDLASYLITTDQGHMLINTGVGSSVPQIRSNIESLGLRFADIRLLLATHGHWDHVGGMAAIKRMTGARMLMHEADVPVLEDGGSSDFRFYPKGRGTVYEPVKVDQALKDGEKVRLGTTELTVHHHPGHTKGATSFTFMARDGGRDYRVGIINMNGINDGVLLLKSPGYPKIVEEYAQTFAKQKQIALDVFLSSHAGQFRLHEKYKAGTPYDPSRFVDPMGYRAAVERAERSYLEQLQKERQGPSSR
jgi:metallo-beta-lactamase class B